ncbi:MAG TPA: NAD(P)/FAD-dependent oxidoreductase [Ktedonobacteraceae bacterium]|nr:NAD(P)/FAD-dependent oxidoreductase [Ktedonobacteraceae bacterium]
MITRVLARSYSDPTDFGNRTQSAMRSNTPSHRQKHVHIAIVGTGFSGLGIAIRLKQHGYQDFAVLERAADIGGTWRDNTYPGCACDIPSNLYSFSFAPNPNWSHLYPPQPEIQDYLRSCAKRFGVFEHILFNCELRQAVWREDDQCWHLKTAQGALTTDILIAGQGPLSEPSLPALPGLERFEGALFHSARWKHDYDLTGKRVAVIGTGASSIQFVPQIQPQVEQLKLFQRTPAWIVPRRDHEVPGWQRRLFRLLPFTQRFVRAKLYWRHELTVLGFAYRSRVLNVATRLALRHLHRQVPDPVLRTKLTPHYTMGCKRVLVSDDFYPALCQPNVEVITDSLREVRARSIVTADGTEHAIDAIICGTGFHVTDTQFPRQVYGSDGRSLAEHWREGISAYRGTTVSGFPNLFLLIGPNTGLGHNSMVFMIESQVTYILDCLRTMKRNHLQTFDVRAESQEAFNQALQERMQKTVWASGCASWYMDARGRNTTLWPEFTFNFWQQMRHFDAEHYHLFLRKKPADTGETPQVTSVN